MFFKKSTAKQDDTKRQLPSTAIREPIGVSRSDVINRAMEQSFSAGIGKSGTMDSFGQPSVNNNLFGESISNTHIQYFGSKGFIGYQSCAMLAQHWLIDSACTIPVEDAVRKGWDITKNDGKEIDNIDDIRLLDKKFGIIDKVKNFARFGRVFGIRIAFFQVESDDPDYYSVPFNIDSITPGSFKGIHMVDPYWITPLSSQRSLNPNDQLFYEPEYWIINGKKYHYTHLVIFRHSEAAQMLKPSYLYGGISLVQQIFEAVYNAEISANEIPMLLQNMRFNVLKTDMSQLAFNYSDVINKLDLISEIKNNHGTRIIDYNDDFQTLQTAVTGLDELVQGRYKIVASIAQMPVAKLMKTDLTGGLVKGGGEEAIYHETLESLQIKIKSFLEKYYKILLKSEFEIDDNIDIVFNKLDAMTEKEQAEVNEIVSRTDLNYIQGSVFDNQDIRKKVIEDMQSGYSGMDMNAPGIEDYDGTEEDAE